LVTLGVPASLADVFQCRVTEEMLLVLPDDGNGILSAKASGTILDFLDSRADILAIGPGIGVSSDTARLLTDLVRNSRSPVIIDADGIHSLAGNKTVLKKARAPLILTPHPGEMAGLLREGRSAKMASKTARRSILDAIESDRINKALSFARENRTCLVLKGVPTVIAAPEGRAFLNPTGNPGMATAGSGDVLTGMIAGFLGQTGEPLDSCILAVYMHGLAGDSAASGKGLHSLIATDIIDAIPAVFLSLEKEQENPVQ
jgi:NAD(P)H-hydrate epimerase